ncbi:MAG: tRNA pseudouridine(38-40) synthase TruA [Eubacterium sp.]|nr:tRNA pseudouridine(38-40) synthase TruA [Eubacterium sp.]
MINYKIRVQYDGTRYKGWQRQKSIDQTIQGKIEVILKKQFGRDIEIDGSGRTDAGVHAMYQVANFRLHEAEAEHFGGEPEALTALLNAYLPEDIAVLETRIASERFHSRLNAVEKTYIYRIWNSGIPNVFDRKYVFQIEKKLDVEQMRQAAEPLLGTHDFAAFCGNAKMKKSTVRSIYEIRIETIGDEVRITYRGNGFLQNMVRILTGTLVEVGLGDRDAMSMTAILESKTRAQAGAMMPACGLTLWEVKYD